MVAIRSHNYAPASLKKQLKRYRSLRCCRTVGGLNDIQPGLAAVEDTALSHYCIEYNMRITAPPRIHPLSRLMNTHCLYFKHPAYSQGRNVIFAYGNNFAYKFDENFNYINQEPISFPHVSNIANGFPSIKIRNSIYGIPLNSKKLYVFRCYDVQEMCPSPSVYTYGYCGYFNDSILCYDYFKHRFYRFDKESARFVEEQVDFNELDVQLFQYEGRVYLFSKHTQFVGVMQQSDQGQPQLI